MNYPNICRGIFLSRPNRFVAVVKIDDEDTICHVKNTGRLRELLLPGAVCYLTKSDNLARKTVYDLVAVERGEEIVNIDSTAPNAVAKQYLAELYPDSEILAEKTFAESRFDFMVKRKEGVLWVEVKGVTLLCKDGIARFPDAPTARGVKHIEHLIAAKEAGQDAMLLFVVAMSGAVAVAPNRVTHPAFADVMQRAERAGVALCAIDCVVQKEGIYPQNPLPVRVDL
jgi:sugar fermentation stimulation protein A